MNERHAEREQDLGAPPNVGQSLADLPPGPNGGRGQVQPAAVDQQQGHQEGEVAQGVGQDGPARADGRDHQSGHRRADDPGGVEARRVEADRVGQMIRSGDLRDQRLPGRVVEGRAEAEQQRQQVHVPRGRHSGHGQQAEDERTQGQPGLGDQQDPALVEPVRDQAAVRAEQQHRQELQARRDADRERRPAGQLEHEPVLGHPLHPGADVGDEGAAEVDPVVAVDQGREHPAPGGSGGVLPGFNTATRWSRLRWNRLGARGVDLQAHGRLTLSKITTAWRSTSRSAALSRPMRTVSHSSRRRRLAKITSRPAGVSVTRHCRPSRGSGRRAT